MRKEWKQREGTDRTGRAGLAAALAEDPSLMFVGPAACRASTAPRAHHALGSLVPAQPALLEHAQPDQAVETVLIFHPVGGPEPSEPSNAERSANLQFGQ